MLLGWCCATVASLACVAGMVLFCCSVAVLAGVAVMMVCGYVVCVCVQVVRTLSGLRYWWVAVVVLQYDPQQ